MSTKKPARFNRAGLKVKSYALFRREHYSCGSAMKSASVILSTRLITRAGVENV